MNDTLWRRLATGIWRIRQRPDWEAFAGPSWVDHIMAGQVADDFHAKQGRSTARWIVENNGRRLVVYLKRHYHLPWWRGWLATLRPNRGASPAMQEWRNLEWARNQGLPVPAPVSAGELIGPWGRFQSFLAVEELAGMLPLHQALPAARQQLDPLSFQQWKQTLSAELARLVRSLHERRRFHRDLYLCHFYVAADDTKRIPHWPGRVHLIDFHRLTHRPWTPHYWRIKDLAQLLYSSDLSGVSNSDRLRFWQAYLGANWKRHRWLLTCTLFKGRRYRRHNQKKKRRMIAGTKS